MVEEVLSGLRKARKSIRRETVGKNDFWKKEFGEGGSEK